jgi:RNA-directed DNA polymerase
MLWDASGSLRMYADDERTREVGQTHSTGEVSEQGRATGGGGDGGKGFDQGKSATANASRTLSRTDAPSALGRIRQAANKDKEMRFTALLHHVFAPRLCARPTSV